MVVDWLLVLIGFAVLLAGGEVLVRGASGVALFARITPTVVGLTVVAAGTSAPELVVSIHSAVVGSSGIAIGNVVGSNIFNIAAILGLTAMIRPLKIEGVTVRLEWPVMFLASLQLYLLARDGVVDRLEGGFLLTALVIFLAYVVRIGRQGSIELKKEGFAEPMTASFGRSGGLAVFLNVSAIVLGGVLLALGSSALVRGATSIAAGFGVSDTIIGLTVVAAGTSAPELFTSLVAAWRGNQEIAVGNLIGSSIFNVLGIVGATALILPLTVPAEIMSRDILWMLASSLLLFPFMYTGMRVNRVEGAVLFVGFLVYMTLLIMNA